MTCIVQHVLTLLLWLAEVAFSWIFPMKSFLMVTSVKHSWGRRYIKRRLKNLRFTVLFNVNGFPPWPFCGNDQRFTLYYTIPESNKWCVTFHMWHAYSNTFSSKTIYQFLSRFHWSLFLFGPNNNIPALIQIVARYRPGDKPLSEAMLVNLLTQKSVTQWGFV